MLPLVIHQVAFGDKAGLAVFTLVRLLTLMLDPDVLVDASLVKGLHADGTVGVEVALLVRGQEVGLVLQPDVSGQAGAVDKDFATIFTLLRLALMLPFLVPVQVSLSLEHFATVTEELFGWLDWSVLQVNPLVL